MDYLKMVKSGMSLLDVPEDAKNPEICLEAIRLKAFEVHNIPEELKSSLDFCLEAAKINGLILQFINPAIPNYREVCLAAIKQNGEVIRYFKGNFDGEILAYAKYSDKPFDLVGHRPYEFNADVPRYGYLESINNEKVIGFLEPLAQKYETLQGFLESQEQLSGLKKHGYHHKMNLLKLVQGFADVDVPYIDPDILTRYRKEHPRELKGPWVDQLIDRKQEEAFSNEAAEKDAALPSEESKSAIADKKERDKFIPLISAEEPSIHKGPPPLVFPLTEPTRRGGRKTRKRRKTRRR